MFHRKKGSFENRLMTSPYWIRVFLKTVLDKGDVFSNADDWHFKAYSEIILRFVEYKAIGNNTWQYNMKPEAIKVFRNNPHYLDGIPDQDIRRHARRTDKVIYKDHFSTEFYWWYYSNDDFIEPTIGWGNPFPTKQEKSVQTMEVQPYDRRSIDDEMYNNIIRIIESCCYSMENTAKTFASQDEEQLRDSIISALSTHYPNSSGETFRRSGKTDICIKDDNAAAFVAECKIWHGDKVFLNAIEQLFSYTTWKDTKVCLIIFNNNNKNYELLLNKIDNLLKERAVQVDRTQDAQWRCVIQNEERERDMLVTVQVFDLYV